MPKKTKIEAEQDGVMLPSQRQLIQNVVVKVSKANGEYRVEVGEAIDEALRVDRETYAGQVFHEGSTPRNSARRALYQLIDTETLFVKDGRGYVRFRTEALRNSILQGDMWEIAKMLGNNAFDCIVADGPNTSLDIHRSKGKATRMTNGEYFKTKDLDHELLSEFYRILKPGGWCFLYMPLLRTDVGLDIWLKVLTAVKQTPFEVLADPQWSKLRRGMGYRATPEREPIMALGKLHEDGRLPDCHDRKVTDVWRVKPLRGKNRTPYTDFGPDEEAQWKAAIAKYGKRGEIPREVRKSLPGQYHETEKPPELARIMLKMAYRKGGIALDAFAGSGHLAVVAPEFGMDYTAVEFKRRAVRYLLAPRLRRAGIEVKTIIEVEAQ